MLGSVFLTKFLSGLRQVSEEKRIFIYKSVRKMEDF